MTAGEIGDCDIFGNYSSRNQQRGLGVRMTGGTITGSRIFGNRKPVLAVTPATSDLADCVRAADGGVVVSENSARALADAILALRASPERCRAHGEHAGAYARQFIRAAVGGQYDVLIRSCI